MTCPGTGAGRRVCIHQPVYFPWLGFFHKLSLSDVYVILDDCQATKRSWINRVYIRNRDVADWLTVPVLYKHRSTQLVSEMLINRAERWRVRHLKTIRQQYSRSPFFAEAEALMQEVLERDWENLMELNLFCIDRVLRRLGLQVEMRRASELGYEPALATQRIINIVRAAGGDTYVCGMGSGGYLEEDLFDRQGLGLVYQQYRPLPYDQGPGREFLPGLSILDTVACADWSGALGILEANAGAEVCHVHS